MPTWPVSLPQKVEQDGFIEQLPNLLLRTTMDVGPPKQRRRFTSGVRPFTMKAIMTTAQVATFDSFYITDLEGGALSFTFTNPRTGSSELFRFTGQPKYSPLADNVWEVDLPLERMP